MADELGLQAYHLPVNNRSGTCNWRYQYCSSTNQNNVIFCATASSSSCGHSGYGRTEFDSRCFRFTVHKFSL